MLRSFLIYLSQAEWAMKLVTNWSVAWKVASRFISGNTIDQALQVVKELNSKGMNATLDQLGEHTSNADEANSAADGIIATLEAIDKAKVKANVSIKLTQIGMGMDNDVCKDNLRRILTTAKRLKNFVRIDIEDTPFTDLTYDIFKQMLSEGFGVDTVGVATQSYLYRAEKDVRELLELEAKFRLIKGAYKEPENVAYPKKADVDSNFDNLSAILMDASLKYGSRLGREGILPAIPAIGTHDQNRIDFAKRYAEKIGLEKEGYEFQFLFGIRRDLQNQLSQEGYLVRIYVPFGSHWYPYFMRRLAERPANIWFFVSNFFKS